MSRTLLAISPHLDDAIFSAGGTLAQRAAQGWRVVVATCFTQSVQSPTGFALACQLDKGLAADVDYMALRREEDRAACASISAEAVHLPLPEAPHRGYESAAALFAQPLIGDLIGIPLTAALDELVVELQPSLILAPLAIGGHVDHVIVRRTLPAMATTTATGSDAIPMHFWQDWPYVDRHPAVTPPSSGIRALVQTKLSAADMTQKIAGCRAYASQLGFQFGSAKAMTERLAKSDTEYFWSANNKQLSPLP